LTRLEKDCKVVGYGPRSARCTMAKVIGFRIEGDNGVLAVAPFMERAC